MKTIICLFVLLLLSGCTPSSTTVRPDAGPGAAAPVGTFNSQLTAPVVPPRGESTVKYFVPPPLNFADVPIRQALDTVFAKAGAKYVIEDQLIDRMGLLTYSMVEKRPLDDILNELILSRGMIYFIDGGNVYHVKANLVPLGR